MQKIYLQKKLLLAIPSFVFSICFLFSQESRSQVQDFNKFKTFEDWCENKDNLNQEIRHTVEQLLLFAKISDCKFASEKLSSGKSLYLNNLGISDLRPLTSLRNIIRLSLNKNQITDIKPLEKLVNITELSIGDNQISDITPLKNMRYLKHLSARRNQIFNVTPLQSLTELQFLFLNNNKITDISSLQSLKELSIAVFTGNPIVNQICPTNNSKKCLF
jgi:Leucine-rich repeat (LRR) protein